MRRRFDSMSLGRRSRTPRARAGGLLSSRLSLGPITRADAPQLFRWINDRAMVLSSAPYRPIDEPGHVEWLRSLSKRADLTAFAIRMRQSGKLVGVCQLANISRVNRSAELQLRLGDLAARGRGIASEALSLLMDFAFRDMNLNRVYGQVFRTNKKSLAMCDRVGLVAEGVLREAVFVDGRYVDVVVVARLRDDYDRGNPR